MNQLKQTAADVQTQAKEAKYAAEEAKITAQVPAANTVASSQGRVKLDIYGQVNRALNIIDDGKNTEAYYEDNDASNSRCMKGSTLKIGTHMSRLGSKHRRWRETSWF